MKLYRYEGTMRLTADNGETAEVEVTMYSRSRFFLLIKVTSDLRGWATAEWVGEPVVTEIDQLTF